MAKAQLDAATSALESQKELMEILATGVKYLSPFKQVGEALSEVILCSYHIRHFTDSTIAPAELGCTSRHKDIIDNI